jgi:hypothetical protein
MDPLRPTWGLWYWPAFLIVTSLAFLPAEVTALFTNSVNTLSDYSWFELSVDPHLTRHTIAWAFSLIVWLLFVTVITGHIWFRSPG